MRIEWRDPGQDNDVLIAVDDTEAVVEAWDADPALLADFLNEMPGLDAHKGTGALDISRGAPQQWGNLVIARTPDGGIASIDPGLYWDRVTFWFRARGEDPHSWTKTR